MASKTKAQVSLSIIGADLPAAASNILINNISPETIAGGQGIAAAKIGDTDFVNLALFILDMTGSMGVNKAAVIKMHAEMIEALKASQAGDAILVSTWVFNDTDGSKLIHSYLPLDLVPDLVGYEPDHQTNLYDSVLDGITALLQYEHDLNQAGMRTQSMIIPFTDGDDNASSNSASDVATVVKSLLAKEKYLVSLVGFGPYDKYDPDFEQKNKDFAEAIAMRMGIPTGSVLGIGSTAHDMRLAAGTVSKSVIRASQTKIGGKSQSGFFTTPSAV